VRFKMVFYYTSSEGYLIYMGRDKFENEDLIRFGLPEDVWFHVDDLSSAHVYLRLRPGQTLDDLSEDTINECATMVKANSIEGCKKRRVSVIYTRWKNLHKTPSMDVGAVGFKDESRVRRCHAEKDNSIVNALNRTKEERYPDLEAEQAERAAQWRREQKRKKEEAKRREREERQKREEEKKLQSYEGLMDNENDMTFTDQMESTEDQTAAVAFEDDFM